MIELLLMAPEPSSSKIDRDEDIAFSVGRRCRLFLGYKAINRFIPGLLSLIIPLRNLSVWAY